MEFCLQLGGLLFRFQSERPLTLGPELRPFLMEEAAGPAAVSVSVSWDWQSLSLPQTDPLGQDALLTYYAQGERRWCYLRGGPKGPIGCTVYGLACTQMACTINAEPFLYPIKAVGSILRMLPLREIFLRHQTLFLHASQISYRGQGILFAAPSGTGKTTQAKLWRQYRGAELVCNDRTLTRKADGCWRTWGYPLDGSEPVRSTAVNRLGCVVLLQQGAENRVTELRPARAAGLLMRQAVMDCWNSEARAQTLELICTLLQDVPVLLLTCRPDEQAVQALEAALIEKGVLSL